jgi:transcription elongation factor Elf1
VLVWLFLITAAIVVAMVLFGSMDELTMPFACPSCHHDSGQVPWYRAVDREGRVRCANCGAIFKEHPNGSLVRDPDV